jgi:hypothetical protein
MFQMIRGLRNKEEIKMICGNCRYFNPDFDFKGNAGECRKTHPTLIVEGITRLSAFPPVVEGSWCGEFRAKEN